ncbi:MAG: RIP metalloprotease RseP [Verrucomicrobia bacterium]|nr:RIP metalloprotease RseP [Verrucomicrobiota bacterium]MCG2680229.1 RIP metalloprotease RseP [Kiritimatiellia bacterium]MBU4247678.1 RIP metalloprotease RseP [Verrucomicrobiota bacterium]MBU4289806.1 RIP metalloprotease RseP [Verrucomicrobiota bacterium]MBU4428051.1 RIP metalloprotease RseP [Verrucomicrobiota bacterium]
MWDIAFDVIKVILLFSVTIFVHELGHFLAARSFGMVIEVFSIGIGPALWKRKVNGVIYKIGWIPFGGYVALPQMDPTLKENSAGASSETGPKSEATDDAPPPSAVPRVSPGIKIVVALAGAFGNMALAVLLAWIIFWTGKPSTPAERCSVIGFVETNSAAYAAGLRTGDEIVDINGRSVNSWTDVLQENARFDDVALTVRTPDGTRSIRVPTEKSLLGFNMVAGLREMSLCRVMAVEPDSSAAQAGMQIGDLIETFDGVSVLSIAHLITLVAERPDQAVTMSVDRRGQSVELLVTPRTDPALGRARIGIRFDPMAVDSDKVVHIPPGVQLKSHATAILRVVASLLTPGEARSTSQGLGGPFMILFMLFDMVRRGLIIALWFTCFLNVNLAILNLLPIPILDGGHILFSLIETVFRKPLNPKIINAVSQVFAGLLITVFILLSGRDVLRINQIRQLSKPQAVALQGTNGMILPATNGAESPTPVSAPQE